jgi:hypothetical protein
VCGCMPRIVDDHNDWRSAGDHVDAWVGVCVEARYFSLGLLWLKVQLVTVSLMSALKGRSRNAV